MLSKISLLFLAVSCVRALSPAPPAMGAEGPSPRQLIDLAPAIKSSDGAIRSIEIAGYMREPELVNINFRALYRAPDRSALLICDGSDGAPLLLVADRQLLVYDPVGSALLLCPAARFDFSIVGLNDTFFLGFGAGFGSIPSRITLDLGSLYRGIKGSDEVVQTCDKTYRLSRTRESGSFFVADIDMLRTCPFSRIEMIDTQEIGQAFCLEKIVVDGPLGDEQFSFPSRAQLAEKVRVRDVRADNLIGRIGGSALILKSCYARLAARNPELRKNIKFPGLSGIDWEKVQENDRVFSTALRDVLKPSASTRLPTRDEASAPSQER